MTTKQTATRHLSQLVFYVLLISVIGLAAWLSTRYSQTIDVSFGQRNTLTEPTQQLLKSLDEPVNFIAYLSDDKTELQAGMRKLVAKYQQFKPDTTLEIIDPNLNPVRAKADNVLSEGRVLIQLGDRSEKLSSVDESTVANTLQRLLRNAVPRIIVLEGHQERSPFDNTSSGLSKLRERLADRGFRLQPHAILKTQSIPDDSSFVLIASPRTPYLPTEAEVIKQYLKDGGNLLWLTEPDTLAGLEPVLEQLGLITLKGTLLDGNQALQDMLGIKHPAVIPVIQYQHPLLKDMQSPTLFPFAGVIEANPEIITNWQYSPMLITGESSWLESGELTGEVTPDYAAGDKPGPLSIGMSLSREINGQQQRVVVLGDSDFMLNQFIGAGNGGNLELSNKLFDWLSQSDDLLKIKTARAPDTELKMPGNSLNILAIVFLFGLPLLLVIIGTVRWWIRRRR
jgi:ABC-type uncharacterized transport system involved in gliding motility auxiliary subunit